MRLLNSRSGALVFIAFLSLLAQAAVAAPAVIRARVEEPVVPDLMGGCSLRCAFAWEVEVLPTGDRGKATRIKQLNDEQAETAWIGSEATGIGTRVTLLFPKKMIPELERTPVYGLDVINGHWSSEDLWRKHSRVKRMRIHYNNRPFRDVTFSDSRRWHRITFPDIYARSGDTLTLEIMEVYPGTGGGVALSELVLQGGH